MVSDPMLIRNLAGISTVASSALGAGETFGIGFGTLAGITSIGMFALGVAANNRANDTKRQRRDARQRRIGRRQTLIELQLRGVQLPPGIDLGEDDDDAEED